MSKLCQDETVQILLYFLKLQFFDETQVQHTLY